MVCIAGRVAGVARGPPVSSVPYDERLLRAYSTLSGRRFASKLQPNRSTRRRRTAHVEPVNPCAMAMGRAFARHFRVHWFSAFRSVGPGDTEAPLHHAKRCATLHVAETGRAGPSRYKRQIPACALRASWGVRNTVGAGNHGDALLRLSATPTTRRCTAQGAPTDKVPHKEVEALSLASSRQLRMSSATERGTPSRVQCLAHLPPARPLAISRAAPGALLNAEYVFRMALVSE